MNTLSDMVEMTDDVLCDLAREAFKMGLEDGRLLANPISARKLWEVLPWHSQQRFHTKKMRQVYGAGFDLALSDVLVRKKERAKGGE